MEIMVFLILAAIVVLANENFRKKNFPFTNII